MGIAKPFFSGTAGVSCAAYSVKSASCCLLLRLSALGATHQPRTADDQDHAHNDLRQLIHHQIKCAEEGAALAPAPHDIPQRVHKDVLVGHQCAQHDQAPSQQFVAVHHELLHPLVLPVDMHQIIVLRGGACADLRPEIEGVKKLYIHTMAQPMVSTCSVDTPITTNRQNIVISERPRFI